MDILRTCLPSTQDQVAIRFKDCIDDFKQIMPLVEELANPALKKRHWTEIFEVDL